MYLLFDVAIYYLNYLGGRYQTVRLLILNLIIYHLAVLLLHIKYATNNTNEC